MTNFNDWAGQYSGNSPSTVNLNMNFQQPMRTNRTYVNSLQEALSIPTPVNSETVYFDSDPSKQLIYVVRTDINNLKSYSVLKYTIMNPTSTNDDTADKFEKLCKEVEELKKRINKLDSPAEVRAHETSE